MEKFKFERRVALFTGVTIVGVVLFLLLRNQEVYDPNLAVAMRILLSLSVATIGATIPGFLKVEYKFSGVAIRATGAMALFIITYFFTPEVKVLGLQNPSISIYELEKIDFRTAASPNKLLDERLNAEIYVTIPINGPKAPYSSFLRSI